MIVSLKKNHEDNFMVYSLSLRFLNTINTIIPQEINPRRTYPIIETESLIKMNLI